LNSFPTDFLKKKRLYIVRNLEEINQQEYENEDIEEAKAKKKDKEMSLQSSPNKKALSTQSA